MLTPDSPLAPRACGLRLFFCHCARGAVLAALDAGARHLGEDIIRLLVPRLKQIRHMVHVKDHDQDGELHRKIRKNDQVAPHLYGFGSHFPTVVGEAATADDTHLPQLVREAAVRAHGLKVRKILELVALIAKRVHIFIRTPPCKTRRVYTVCILQGGVFGV
jgi:hypothetical protein